VDDEFTVGTSILVAPILNSNPERDVYLPQGTWIDFWDEKETITGPVTISWSKGWNLEDRGKFPLYIREGAIIPMEICNDVTGFGWAESKGYLTVAIWPKKDDLNEFILEDTEEPVKITSDWKTQDVVQISWDKTNINYILRVHLNSDKIPAELQNRDQSILSNKYSSIDLFRKDNNEGWFYDEAAGNLWVRKNNQDKQNSIQIRLE
jgi:alpha-D-xyloside xylohydrolase